MRSTGQQDGNDCGTWYSQTIQSAAIATLARLWMPTTSPHTEALTICSTTYQTFKDSAGHATHERPEAENKNQLFNE
jgi:hypothetical protein